jgi:hypothetical protein
VRRALRHPHRLEVGGEHGGGEEVVLQEVAEDAADAVLLRRDDGGVRDRQAQRPAEQRGDGEPVGDASHQRGLGGGTHHGEPGVRRFEQPRHDEHQQRHAEEPRGDALHRGELRLPLRFVARWRRRERNERRGGLAGSRHPVAPVMR